MKTKIFSLLILAAGLSTSTFAGSPKSETKAATPTEVKSETSAGTNLVWYKITYDATHTNGYIPSGTTPIYNGDKSGAEALEECDPGNTRDCLRGFNSAPALPTNNTGADQVKTDEMP